MALTLEEVRRVAYLARIAIDDDEAQAAHRQINDVFALIARMQAVDTAGIEPMSHALDLVQRLRHDAVTEGDERTRFQAVAPHVEDGLYLVPRVIE